MIGSPEEQEIVKLGESMERFVTSPEWSQFTALATKQRDQWLGHTAINQDRVYLSAQANTVNILLAMPFTLIEAKNQLIADLRNREKQDEESGTEEHQTRPAPQAV
jgi:hypothetical protein